MFQLFFFLILIPTLCFSGTDEDPDCKNKRDLVTRAAAAGDFARLSCLIKNGHSVGEIADDGSTPLSVVQDIRCAQLLDWAFALEVLTNAAEEPGVRAFFTQMRCNAHCAFPAIFPLPMQ